MINYIYDIVDAAIKKENKSMGLDLNANDFFSIFVAGIKQTEESLDDMFFPPPF